MRWLSVPVVCLLAGCSPEDLSGFQPPARVNEIAHTVTATFRDGSAHLRVRRTLQNATAEYEAVGHRFRLPPGGVATSLRLGTNGQWLAPGTLFGSEEVETRWNELISAGFAEPSTLGKLTWSWGGDLDFDAFGVPPNSTLDVEYEVEVPSTYEAGAVRFEYPLEDAELGWLPPSFPGFEVQQLESTLEVRRAWTTRDAAADVRWATFPVDTNRTLWRLEVDVAAQLGELPRNANVVFVVDASISEGALGVAAQLELIAPYLANVPDARVEVVVFRRFAQRLFGRFVPASEFTRELALVPRERLEVGNGSHLDVGAQLAFETLTREGGLGRVVLFTDERLRDALTPDVMTQVMQGAPRDVVVHVVERTEAYGASLRERRDDLAALSKAAAVTGGIFLRVTGHPSDPVLDADVMRGLVRPIRIDSFEVVADGEAPVLDEDEAEDDASRFTGFRVDDVQNEGAAVRLADLDAVPPQRVTVRGKIWARSFERVVTPDEALSRLLPGFAVGDDSLRNRLSEDELRTVAFVSGAVSPVTSYLAAPPSAAPSVIGFEVLPGRGGLGMRGVGCSGCGTSSRCGLRISRASIDLTAALRVLLQPGLAACEARLGPVGEAKLELEATADEVVDVRVAAASEAMGECLTEVAWAVRLTESFEAHKTYVLELH